MHSASFYHFIDIFGTMSYVLIIVAFMMTDIFYLRLITIASSLSGIIYFSLCDNCPLWIDLFWQCIFIGVNTVQLAILIYEQRQAHFDNKEEEQIYYTMFPHFSCKKFKKLLSSGTLISVPAGEKITEQNVPVPYLNLILNGTAKVEINDKTVAYCTSGNLVGEMSFMSGQLATATVTTVEPTHYISWGQENLKMLLKSDPEIEQGMQSIFNKNLIDKLMKSTNSPAPQPREL